MIGNMKLSVVIVLSGFVISPVRNSLLGLTPENFLKFEIFPSDSSNLQQGIETGCEM